MSKREIERGHCHQHEGVTIAARKDTNREWSYKYPNLSGYKQKEKNKNKGEKERNKVVCSLLHCFFL